MKMPLFRSTFAAAIAAVAASAILPARASTFTVELSTSGSTTTFTVSRSGDGTNAAETVFCRTVSRSALAGVHFTGALDRLDFAAGDISKTTAMTIHPSASPQPPSWSRRP